MQKGSQGKYFVKFWALEKTSKKGGKNIKLILA